ncbi:MAG: molybdopterin-dependent oxidoreductase [Ornithinimicrobium sp.]
MTSRVAAPLAGIAAGSVTLGLAEILALAMQRADAAGGTPSPVLAVGGGFVDRTPAWLKDFAVATFGTNDKIALFVGMGLTLLVVCGILGVVTTRRRQLGLGLYALVGIVGSAAVLTRPGSAALDAVPTIVGTLAGLGVLAWLARGAARATAGVATDDAAASGALSRRGVLAWGSALSVVGIASMYVARTMGNAQQAVQVAREQVSERLAQSRGRANWPAELTIPGDADFEIEGLAAYISPNDNFYRIDTALTVPQVDPATWSIRVHGMVDQEIEMTYDELLDQELIQTAVTLTCVSNTVGGDLIGNAVWTGWPIRELLARAGVQPGADMVLSTSTDGWTAGTPLEALTDDRDAILAVLMNDEPMPAQHGFPVRMVVPGLYGYVSATKWVVDLLVTTFAEDEGYWTPRGWTAEGPIKVSSRIDVPSVNDTVQAGGAVIAGVAWDQHTGIEKVEVQVDDGDWQVAELSGEVSIDTWRQWRLEWDAAAGAHTITVRATNRDGETQTREEASPAPSGATGWHSIDVTVA